MAANNPERMRISAELARKCRWTPDDPSIPELRRELKTAELTEHIRRLVDAAPPLTQDQRDRLAVLLRGSTPNGGVNHA